MSYKLAIYRNRHATWEPHQLAIIAPGSDPAKAKYTAEHGYEVVQVIEIDVPAIRGVCLDELYIASSSLYEGDEVAELMEDYPAYDDPDILRHEAEEDQEFMAGPTDISRPDEST